MVERTPGSEASRAHGGDAAVNGPFQSTQTGEPHASPANCGARSLRSLCSSSLAQYVLAALTSFEHARQRAPTLTTRPGARACASRKPRDPGKGRAAVRAGMKGAARSIYPGRR